jgi:hypothetical protein
LICGFPSLRFLFSDKLLIRNFLAAPHHPQHLHFNDKGAALAVYAFHIHNSLFAYTSGNTLNLLGSDGSVNLDGTQFNYTRGDMFWNTNPAYSSGLGIYITGMSTVKLN